jgi:hypothetical protein
MLTITDFQGNDLLYSPPADSKLLASAPTGAPFKINVRVEENNPSLPHAYINGTVDWHDGSVPVVYSGTGTLASQRPSRFCPVTISSASSVKISWLRLRPTSK